MVYKAGHKRGMYRVVKKGMIRLERDVHRQHKGQKQVSSQKYINNFESIIFHISQVLFSIYICFSNILNYSYFTFKKFFKYSESTFTWRLPHGESILDNFEQHIELDVILNAVPFFVELSLLSKFYFSEKFER